MSKRFEKLLDELGLPRNEENKLPGIPIRDIKTRVDKATGTDSQARKTAMSPERLRLAMTAALITVLSITFAFAAVNFDVLKTFFAGDASPVEQFVKTPRISTSDGHFKLTLEELLTDQEYVLMIYSIEGLTDEAIDDLMRDTPQDDFMYINTRDEALSTMSILPHSQKYGNSFYQYELLDKRTATARYWAYYDKLDDPRTDSLQLRLNKMSGDRALSIPLSGNLHAKELTLTGQPYCDVLVRLSPIGITVEKGTKSGETEDTMSNQVFFRMKDGTIKTYNQLASILKGYMLLDEIPSAENPAYFRYRYEARFLDAIPLSEFKSIIVGNTEYDIDNPAKMHKVTLDPSLYPFKTKALFLEQQVWMPLQDVCDQLGAKIKRTDNTVTIVYRGSTVKITEGSATYSRDDTTIPYQMPQSPLLLTYEGKHYVCRVALAEALGIDATRSDDPIVSDSVPAENTGGGMIGISIITPRAPQYVTWYIIP